MKSYKFDCIHIMASKIKRRRTYCLVSESSDSECSVPDDQRKKLKLITVGQSSLKEIYDHSSRKDDVRAAIKDKNTKFKRRNKGNTCHANIKPVKECKGTYYKHFIYFRPKYTLNEDSYDSSTSSDNDSNKSRNEVEDVGSRPSANRHDASNSVVTNTPLPQNTQENKKKQEAVTNNRHRILKMAKELKCILSKFKLKVDYFQLKYLQDEIVTEQDGENIMCAYNSIINKLKKQLTVQQQISVGPYHRSGETTTNSQSNSKILSANYKRPEVTKISKPDIQNNVNKQQPEANSISVVTVEKSNNTTTSKSESVLSLLHKLKEINVTKTSSTSSVSGSISTVRSVPNIEVLNRAYEKSIGCQDTTKQDSLRNGRLKENGTLAHYESDVNSTCSTIALYPRTNGIVGINNVQGGFIRAAANKDVSSKDVPNRDVPNRDESNRDVSNRDVSKSPISDVISMNGEMSDEIPLTHLYSSDSEDTLIISNNKKQNLKSRSKEYIPAKGKTVLTSSNSENIKPKQQSEFVASDINNLSRNYQSHRVAISNRADSVRESKPTEQNQYNTPVDEKLRVNCQVVIEKLRKRR